jgi:hypothetical protein
MRTVLRSDNLTTLMRQLPRNSESLKLLEPKGPVQTHNRTALFEALKHELWFFPQAYPSDKRSMNMKMCVCMCVCVKHRSNDTNRGKAMYSGRGTLLLPLCPPQIPH